MTKQTPGPKSARPPEVSPKAWKKKQDADRARIYRAKIKKAASPRGEDAPATGRGLTFKSLIRGIPETSASPAALDSVLINFADYLESGGALGDEIQEGEAKIKIKIFYDGKLELATVIDLEKEPPSIKKHIWGLYNYTRKTWAPAQKEEGNFAAANTRLKGYRLLWEKFEPNAKVVREKEEKDKKEAKNAARREIRKAQKTEEALSSFDGPALAPPAVVPPTVTPPAQAPAPAPAPTGPRSFHIEGDLEVKESAPAPAAIVEGPQTRLFISKAGDSQPEARPARYELAEARDLITSHDPETFRPDPRYPGDVQERRYDSDAWEQMKVITNSERLIPEYLLNTNPDSLNGPAVVGPRGIVLGGNSRVMTLKRAYKRKRGEEYRKSLKEKAPLFGLDPTLIDDMDRPVLIRTIDAADQEMADLSRRLNEGQTQEKDAAADAVSASKRLSDSTLTLLGAEVKEDETLNDYLKSPRARPFIKALFNDGLIEERNANKYTAGADLSDDGREMVKRALTAKMIPVAALVESLGPARREAIARALPAFMAARADGHDIGPDLQRAAEDLQDKEARGINTLTEYDAQGSLFGAREPITPIAKKLRNLLDEGPRKFTGAIRAFAKSTARNQSSQGGLFGAPPSTEELILKAEGPE